MGDELGAHTVVAKIDLVVTKDRGEGVSTLFHTFVGGVATWYHVPYEGVVALEDTLVGGPIAIGKARVAAASADV